MTLEKEDIARVKGMGFLLNRGTECFSGRIVCAGGVFTAAQLSKIAECAEKYGNGKVVFTVRLAAEIVGIPYENIEPAQAFAKEADLYFGGTGAKIRPITSCKGTTCVFGNFDTQQMVKEMHDRYYIGWTDVKLPHKFKIAVGGCPNSCMKPSLNDFGVEAHYAAASPEKVNYQIFVGGTWGKKPRMGTALSRRVERAEIFPLLERTLLWFKENAYAKERLGAAIDRVGAKNLEGFLFEGAAVDCKEAMMKIEVKKRP